jgi:hypothetical protein
MTSCHRLPSHVRHILVHSFRHSRRQRFIPCRLNEQDWNFDRLLRESAQVS